jgi:amidase
MTELIWRGARELTRAIRTRELSCHDLMSACYDQIERLNPDINAIVNLLPRA